MLLHRHTLCPNGHIVTTQTDLSAISDSTIAKYAVFFQTSDMLSACGYAPTSPDIAFEWLGTPFGQAKFECRYRERIVLRDALVMGHDPNLDQRALRLLARDLAGSQVLGQSPEEWPHPLRDLICYHERPVLVGVLWPELPPEELEKIASLNIVLAAVYLRHLGQAKSKQAEPGAAADGGA